MSFLVKYGTLLYCLLLWGLSFSQSDKQLIRKGNDLYKSEDYVKAEVEYLKSLEKNAQSFEGEFNLGDALYKQGKYEEATKVFDKLKEMQLSKEEKARVYHNLGNSQMKANKLKEAVDSYKHALRNNPQDQDTKYNLAQAMRMLQQQQEQNQENKEDQEKDEQKDKQDQEQKQDQENQEKNEENQDKQDQDKNEESDQQEKEQPQKPKEGELSKEDAERLLNALNRNEKDLQEKLQKKKKAVKIKIEKDW